MASASTASSADDRTQTHLLSLLYLIVGVMVMATFGRQLGVAVVVLIAGSCYVLWLRGLKGKAAEGLQPDSPTQPHTESGSGVEQLVTENSDRRPSVEDAYTCTADGDCDMSEIVIPQDTPIQVPAGLLQRGHTKLTRVHKDGTISAALRGLRGSLQRRPYAVRSVTAMLEYMLAVRDWLRKEKMRDLEVAASDAGVRGSSRPNAVVKLRPYNSQRLEVIRQRIDDLAWLRQHVLEQLQQITHEFNDIPPSVETAIATLRQATYQLYTSAAAEWADQIPSVDHGGEPPFGMGWDPKTAGWSLYYF